MASSSYFGLTFPVWPLQEGELVPAASTDTKTDKLPPPPGARHSSHEPKQAACSCSGWSSYTGLKHECDRCRGKSPLERRLDMAARLEHAGTLLANYGELSASEELMDMAMTIRSLGLG